LHPYCWFKDSTIFIILYFIRLLHLFIYSTLTAIQSPFAAFLFNLFSLSIVFTSRSMIYEQHYDPPFLFDEFECTVFVENFIFLWINWLYA